MNVRKLSVNKAWYLFCCSPAGGNGDGFSSFVWADPKYNRCLVCIIVRHFLCWFALFVLWCWFAANWQCSPMLFAV